MAVAIMQYDGRSIFARGLRIANISFNYDAIIDWIKLFHKPVVPCLVSCGTRGTRGTTLCNLLCLKQLY
jgi:hypothetical protein